MIWRLKLLVQAVLGRLPGGEAINHQLQRLNARRRGPSILANRALDLLRVVQELDSLHPIADAVVVEVGTGWDALPTLCLSGAGARHVHTYDHQHHLRHELAVEASLAAAKQWPSLQEVAASDTLERLLSRARVTYTAPGDATNTGLADQSVDIYFSYAVLEHVPPPVVTAILAEARRVLKPSGIFYALIGLHDHYNGFDRRVSKVNFLKYPDWLWGPLVNNNISYHNRLRERDFLESLASSGAETVKVASVIEPDDVERVKAMKIDRRFHGYSPEELATTQTEITARWPATGIA